MKTLTKAIAGVASLPIAGIIALSCAGSAFAITCPAGSSPAVASNGAELCVPRNDGGVGDSGGATFGNGSSTVTGQAPSVVSGNKNSPQPPPAYHPPPANVAPAPAPVAPAPVVPRPVVPAPAPVAITPQIPVPAAGQAVVPVQNNVESPSAPQEIPATEPEPAKPAEPASESPTASPSSVASSGPVKTGDAMPSPSPTSSPVEPKTAISVTPASSVSPVNVSGITLGAGLTVFVLLGIAVANRLSFAKAGEKVNAESDEV